MYIDIASIRYRYRGEFDSTQTYVERDVVRIGHSAFVYQSGTFEKFLPGVADADSIGELLVRGETGVKGVRDQHLYLNNNGEPEFKQSLRRNGTTVQSLFPNMCRTHGFSRWSTHYYSHFLMTDGTVRGLGYNANGELGDGTTASRTFPSYTAFPKGITIKSGHDGMHQAYYIDQDDRLWGSGDTSYVGQGITGDVLSPHLMNGTGDLPADAKIIDVGSCHDWRGAATSYCITSDYKLYLWGWQDEGRIGNGQTSGYQAYPYTPPSLEGLEIEKCFMGGGERAATYAITRDGILYTAGHSETALHGSQKTSFEKFMPWHLYDETIKVVHISVNEAYSHTRASYYSVVTVTLSNGNYYWRSNGVNNSAPGFTDQTYSRPIAFYGEENTNVKEAYAKHGDYMSHIVLKNDGSIWQKGYGGHYAIRGGDSSTWVQLNLPTGEYATKIQCCGGVYNYVAGILTNNGKLYFWGRTQLGQEGNGFTNTDNFVTVQRDPTVYPTPVLSEETFIDFQFCGYAGNDGGDYNGLGVRALSDKNEAWTWAAGNYGMNNDDDAEWRGVPHKIIF